MNILIVSIIANEVRARFPICENSGIPTHFYLDNYIRIVHILCIINYDLFEVVQRKYGEKCKELMVKGDVMIYLAKKSLMDGIFGIVNQFFTLLICTS